MQVEGEGKNVDDFVNRETTFLKWTDRLKDALNRGTKISFATASVRPALFRPFTAKFLYFDHLLNQRRYQQHRFFPSAQSGNELIWIKIPGEWSFFALATDQIPDYLPQGGSQCFPYYTYSEDGNSRRENITDWALEQFRAHFHDTSITKWDIFHYVYAVLHHRVTRMRLSKDKATLVYNDFLTLSGIPKETFEYRLGNRSALEWVIDQYQVSTDKRSGITNDPNRGEDPEYILRLIGQVIAVSLETVKIVGGLPGLGI